MDQERHKTEWEERIRFVARYYRERTFDPEIGWKQFADKQNIRTRFRIPAWVWQVAAACLLLAGYGIYRMIGTNHPNGWLLLPMPVREKKSFCTTVRKYHWQLLPNCGMMRSAMVKKTGR